MAGSISITGSGSIGDVASWSVSEGAASSVPGETSPTVGAIDFSAKATSNSRFLSNSSLSLNAPTVGENLAADFKQASGMVSGVDIQGPVVSGSALGILNRFNADFEMPAVESGSVMGALDLAMQLTGEQRCNLTYADGGYWSLQGHSSGFDVNNNLIRGIDLSVAKGAITPAAVEYIDRTINIQGGLFATRFSPVQPNVTLDNNPYRIYANRVDGNGMNLAVGGRENIAFKCSNYLPTNNAVTTFGFSHGYYEANTATGFYCNITLEQATNVVRIAGEANIAGILTPFNTTASIAALNNLDEFQVTVEVYFASISDLRITASVSNVGSYGTIASATTGAINTSLGQWTSPWSLVSPAGNGVRGVYQTRTATGIHTALRATDYENAPAYSLRFFPATVDIKYDDARQQNIPIVGGAFNLWQYLSDVCSTSAAEISVVNSVVTLGKRTNSLTFDGTNRILATADKTAPALSVSSLGSGLSVDVAYYDSSIASSQTNDLSLGIPTTASPENLPLGLVGKFFDAEQAGQSLSVNAGETVTITVPSLGFPTVILKPVPSRYWNSPSAWLANKDNAATGLGSYIVSDSTGLPINFRGWLDFGGDVDVSLDTQSGYITITLTGPRKVIPSTTGPYQLAQSDGTTTYPSLTIAGRGILAERKMVNVPTGADPARTTQKVATTIDLPTTSSLGAAFDVAANASVKISGSFPTISFEVPSHSVTGFGLTAGSVFVHRECAYRVISSETNNLSASLECEYYTTVGMFDNFWSPRTVGTFDALWANSDCADFKIAPLLQ